MISWKKIIEKEKKKKYFINLINFLKKEYKFKKNIFPSKKNIFNAFKYTNFYKLKVIIIGQDPYFKKNQADGLAFSNSKKNKIIPPSLKNIFKEIKKTFPKFNAPKNGSLIKWSKQGVLLLNSILTVEEHKPKSHENKGWEKFTNNIIKYINLYHKNIVYLLWGKYAYKKKKIINNKKNLILISSHPSPLSVNQGFIGCNHFILTNNFLKKKFIKPINW